MVDTLEYSNVAFPKNVFTEELLMSCTLAPSLLEESDDTW